MAGQQEKVTGGNGTRLLSPRIHCDFVPTDPPQEGRARASVALDPLALGFMVNLDSAAVRAAGRESAADGPAWPATTDARDLLVESLGESLPEDCCGGAPASPRDARAGAAGECFTRGLARAEAGDHQGAVAEFSAALAGNPRADHADVGRIYLERAYSYRGLGYTYLAIDDFERAGAMGAGWAAAHNGMGMVRREKGDLTGALCDFDTAIRYDAGFAAA